MLKIDKGVPLPNRLKSKFPFAEMNPGDSVFIPAGTPLERKRVVSRAGVYKFDHPGWDYQTAVEKRDGIDGVRGWRV